MKFDPDKPYNSLPPLPPESGFETKAVLKRAIAANRALAELKGIGLTIPNQAMLVDSLILQEAKASSEIENIITTNDALFRAFTANTSQIDAATKEVLRYREALWEGYNTLKKRPVMSTNLFIRIVQTIKQNHAGIAKRQTAAEYLKELEKIGVLKVQKIGRETLYLNWRLYDLLLGE